MDLSDPLEVRRPEVLLGQTSQSRQTSCSRVACGLGGAGEGESAGPRSVRGAVWLRPAQGRPCKLVEGNDGQGGP